MISEFEEIIKEYLDGEEVKLTKDSNLKTDLGLSSFDYFAFLSEVQKKYDVKIPDKKLMEFNTVGDLVEFIEGEKK